MLSAARDPRLRDGGWPDDVAATLEALAERCCGVYKHRPTMVVVVRELAALEAAHDVLRETRAAADAELAAEARAARLAADVADLQARSQLRTCAICTDDEMAPSAGLDCGAAENSHFYCYTCLSNWTVSHAGPHLAGGLRCPGRKGDAPCDAPTYDRAALARGLTAAALEALEKAALDEQRQRMEADWHTQRVALENELAKAKAVAGEGEALRLHVQEHILTPKCPRCGAAFMGFNGCFALRCATDEAVTPGWTRKFCGAAFCAWCFTDCGADAHKHVRS